MTEEHVEKKKMRTGTKVAIGCSSGCLVVFIMVAILIGVGFGYVKKIVTKYENELKGYGFEIVTTGQVLEINEPINEPLLLKGQVVRILEGSTTNVAVLAQVCEVFGEVEGKLYFRGQILTVQPGAVIRDGINATAQVIRNNGRIEGGITGEYQLVETLVVPEPEQEGE